MKRVTIRKTETQAILKKTLSELLINQDIRSITTTKICEHAKINRSTFYANYFDQYDLYDDLIKDSLEKCYKSLSNVFLDCNTLESFLELVKNDALISSLLQRTDDISFFNELKEYERNEIIKNVSVILNHTDDLYVCDFLIDGAFAIIIRWLKNDCKDDIKHISNLIINTIKNINFYHLYI